MPYSDNLYSADDNQSDSESFSNELSPTDGFFHPSPMSPNHMVPDPSLDRKDRTEEDKVLIPRTETRTQSGAASRSPTLGQLFPSQNYASSQSNDRAAPPSTSNTPSSPVSSTRPGNNIFSTSMHRQGPPPAYTPSSPTTSSHSAHNRSYDTFESHRLEQGLPANTEAQSMGRPSDDPGESSPLSGYYIRKPSQRRAIIKKILFIALVVAIAMGILTTLINSESYTPSPGRKLPEGTKPPDLGIPDDPSGPYCTSATIHCDDVYSDFALDKGLTVIQETHDLESGSTYRVRTSGEMRLRKLPKNSRYGSRGVVSMDIHVSDERLKVVKTWDENSRTIRVSTPRTTSITNFGNENCISLEITVWLPEETSLSALRMAATTLTLKVFDDIQLNVTGRSEFSSISGNIYFPETYTPEPSVPAGYPFDSRHINVETVSGNIKGIYPLYDSLGLKSQSGDVNVGVYPQPVLPSAPASADLEASTASGKIQVNFPAQIPRYSPPARDYVTSVGSISGDISGTYFLGSRGSFRSTSGDITAKILPVIQYSPSTDPDDAPQTRFETWSLSGSHDIDILDPVFISLLPSNQNIDPVPYVPIGDNDPYRDIISPNLNEDVPIEKRSGATSSKKWRTLKASHETKSATVQVRYPPIWEGTISGRTISGEITAKGKDVKIISYKKGWASKELIAGKGATKVGEGSTITMSNISGDLKCIVGEE